MAIDEEKVRWASVTETDPLSGLANKSVIPTEYKNSGAKANQPVPRQWINNQFNEIYNAFVDLQGQVSDIIAGQVNLAMEAVYPIGSVFSSFTDNDPATTLGFGTWVPVEAMLAGYKSGDADFGAVDLLVKGDKSHTHDETLAVVGHSLTEAELPTHDHELLTQSVAYDSGASNKSFVTSTGTYSGELTKTTGSGAAHTHPITGAITSTSTLPPYTTLYIFRRVS